MLTINKFDIVYGDKHLFKEVSARVNDSDRIGLVGVNGAGKSTLMKAMAGILETDRGVITRSGDMSVAYLPQEATGLTSERTIYQEAETAFAEALIMQKDLEEVNRRLSTTDPSCPEFAALLKKQGDLQHRLERTDIFRVKSEIEKILAGLGFKEGDLDRPSRSLSGGWLMRLMLAKLLLARPSLLLLDEPTNHLDIESLTWLENFLITYNGGLVIISHDRTFLDRTTTATWELSLGRLTAFKGNYSAYVKEKEVRLQVERAAYENQQAQIRQTMRFVQRFRAKSTKAKQVQSRVKQLAKMERIELSEAEQDVAFQFPPALACGKMAVEVAGLAKNFGTNQVFRDLSFELLRGDKMAVVGVNGAGKSTLMKILAGQEKAASGQIKFGHNAKVSYFGQHQAQELVPDFTVLQTLSSVAGDMTTTQIRSLLGAFLFRGQEVDKKVAVLSGGEKSRLALARMIVQPANLLILDEPTNHLDMSSQEVLQEAMRQYDGTIVIVSHNRYFVNRFVNRVLEIKDCRATRFEGNIDDYLAKVQALAEEATQPEKKGSRPADLPAPPRAQQRDKATRRAQAEMRQEKSRRLTPFKKKVAETEKKIESLENRKKTLEQQLADPELYRNEAAFAECSREYQEVERYLGRQYYKWETAQEEIEKIEAEFD